VREFFAIASSPHGNNCPSQPERGGDAIIIANAAVIVSLDDGTPG
jgi:hypothetical protein